MVVQIFSPDGIEVLYDEDLVGSYLGSSSPSEGLCQEVLAREGKQESGGGQQGGGIGAQEAFHDSHSKK